MRAARSSSEENTTARPVFSNSAGVAAERLRMAPSGASEPNRATRPPCGSSGIGGGLDHAAVDVGALLGRQALAERLAGDGHAVEVQQRLQLAQHGADAAGGEEVLHVEFGADRLHGRQHRRRIGELR